MNIYPTTIPIIAKTIVGGIGLLTLSLKGSTSVIIRYPQKAVVTAIKAYPKIKSISPSPPTIANLTAFLNIRKKESQAAAQKFLPVIAI
jgi:guanylate kinase